MKQSTQEKLDMLAEECAKVIQAIMKINRHGEDSFHPRTGIRNDVALKMELADLLCMIHQVSIDIGYIPTWDDLDTVWKRKLAYTHHQEKTNG